MSDPGATQFLYKPGSDIPANLGLLDMLAALRWVQKEIAVFGGDAERVTIFGESAGGMACGALLGSPLSKGLFSRAICISGSASAAQSEASAGEAAAALAAELGIPYGTCSPETSLAFCSARYLCLYLWRSSCQELLQHFHGRRCLVCHRGAMRG